MSTDIKDQFVGRLKGAGSSITKARSAVFEALSDASPIGMHELCLRVNESVDRASVYRIVELFENLQIVQRVQIGWKFKLELTDAFHEHHHHLSCTNCSALLDIPEDSAIEAYLASFATTQGFAMTSHQLEIQGLCEKCQGQPL